MQKAPSVNNEVGDYQKIGVRTSPFTGTFPTSLEKVDCLYDEHGIIGAGGK
jgi:hypothetical protein